MTKFVAFRTDAGEFCVPAARVASVRVATGVVSLPSPQPHVAGLLQLDGSAVTVLAPLGGGADHLLVLETGGRRFGILVGEVTGVVDFEDAEIGPVPAGQLERLISGVIATGGRLTMLADVDALIRMLDQ